MTKSGATVEEREADLGGRIIRYRLYRSGRRTLEIAVLADGVVEVRAPRAVRAEQIEARLLARAGWIHRRVQDREGRQMVTLPRLYVHGETHRYLGRQYRLAVSRGECARVCLQHGRIHVEVPRPNDRDEVRKVVTRWLQQRARTVIPERLGRLAGLPVFRDLRPAAVQVRTMQSRWGSCSPSGRLLFHVGLVALPISSIDYVIAHELCHLRAPRHDSRFERLLSRVMPDWRERHRRLSGFEAS
jgi:predicted metal-dependent hydrolase